jgi:hypothetical protein
MSTIIDSLNGVRDIAKVRGGCNALTSEKILWWGDAGKWGPLLKGELW